MGGKTRGSSASERGKKQQTGRRHQMFEATTVENRRGAKEDKERRASKFKYSILEGRSGHHRADLDRRREAGSVVIARPSRLRPYVTKAWGCFSRILEFSRL